MEDVREYIRDVLIMYSSLQSFQPKPNDRAHMLYPSLERNNPSNKTQMPLVHCLQAAYNACRCKIDQMRVITPALQSYRGWLHH